MTRTILRLIPSLCCLGLLGATAFAQVDRIAPRRFLTEDREHVHALPYHATHELGEAHEGLSRVLVMVHGTLRNAHHYQAWASSAARAAGAAEHTLVLSPQFLVEQDLALEEAGADLPFWTNAGWKRGNLSLSTRQNERPVRISSYDVLDRAIRLLADTLPDLEEVLVAGHSAGGQYVHRYALSTPIVEELERRGLSIRFFVSNPSSYTYFTPERPHPETPGEFAEPSAQLLAACPGFDRFIYGAGGLNEYIGRLSVAELAAQYAARRVTYLLGEHDNDPESPYLDTSCGALLQGTNRYDRGVNYFAYLGRHFGAQVYETHALVIVPGVGHSARSVFNSPDGLAALFAPAAGRARSDEAAGPRPPTPLR